MYFQKGNKKHLNIAALDFELYWPRGNRVARVIEGGELAGINGYMHLIDGVLIYEPDLRAGTTNALASDQILLLCLLLVFWAHTRRF